MALDLSVCIPIYNGARTIERAVESVRSQRQYDPTRIEIVLVDDRSKDETWQLLRSYAEQPGFRVERNDENLGLTGNWQRALSLGRGEIVTLLCMDDWYEDGCIAAVLEHFENRPELAMLAFRQRQCFEDGSVIVDGSPRYREFSAKEYEQHMLSFDDCPAVSVAFLRRPRLSKLDVYYDAGFRWCPELDLYIRLARANPDARMVHDPRALISRGRSKGQFSAKYPGYWTLDTCALALRYASDMDDASKQGVRRALVNSLSALLLTGDAKQVRTVLSNRTFWSWAANDPQGAGWVAASCTLRGGRKVLRTLRMGPS